MAGDIYNGTEFDDTRFNGFVEMYGKDGDDTLGSNAYIPKFVKIYGGNGDDQLSYYGMGTGLLKGQNGNDYLYGSGWNDKLIGGKGMDWLFGGLGNDFMKGGKGPDHFGFNAMPNSKTNRDKIGDFDVDDDYLHFNTFTYYTLDGMTMQGKLPKGYFVIGSKAKDDDDFFGYNKKKGYVWYDGNADDPGGFYKIVDLNSGLKLKFHNIILD